ncbi:unnamed protein product [Microthlaspi erraticum]|uniref:Uncharacterized protein n=1 Tax=Microthlaspi erraticum TaxID=1685480 RepID=A0A6D2HKD0_9BRAS|nr:unnamed protein product [Microthlaspi erraticum]
MAEIVSAICACCQCLQPVFKCLGKHAGYISKFDDNLNVLRSDLEYLEAKRADVVRRVDDVELKGGQPLDEVKTWCSKVETVETNTNLLVAKASAVQLRRSTCGYCSFKTISTYRCGKKIPKMLIEVKNLLSKDFKEVAAPTLPSAEEEEPVQQTFGLDAKLHSTWELLMQDDIRMLGLYGMGGVGKTTLLTLICNKFVELKGDFDVVIWVEVSKDVDVGKIQDDIGKRLGLCDEGWCRNSQREKKREIRRVLNDWKPRFVLLLDDLWERVSLSDIGIPLQGTKYKIVFTTRSNNVCLRMKANENIEVECLGEEDALKLLKQNARRDALTGERLDLAEKIAKKCHGLPLALEVIGKCLSTRKTEKEWGQVLDTLGCAPDVLEGMENEMFGVLKVSYDYLEKEDAQSCFQYCALFPKAYNINREELVEYWIGEGIIEVRRGRDIAKSQGVEIINTLVGAGLLLKDDESGQKVYMHNMIHEMALWMVSAVREGRRFLVKTDAGLTNLPYETDWITVTKMSLMNNEIASIADTPLFPNPDRLVTLFLQNNKLVDIVGRFFQVLTTLVVLDLSHNPGITELPGDIKWLVSLRYLNLLGTRINSLQGIQDLIELIHLDLESTSNLPTLSSISGLLKLQVLRFYRSAPLDRTLLEKLKLLEGLKLLTITIEADVEVFKAFLGSKLAERTQGLYLDRLEVSEESFAATIGALGSLSKLGMTDCNIIESETEWEGNRRSLQYSPSTSQITPSNKWFKNLSAVVLVSCARLRDLTWLIYAENLESLSVETSPKMEELISAEKARGVDLEPFRKLEVLHLDYLGELKSIYWSPLSFPRLQKVRITNCPALRKLPLNSTSVNRIDDLRIEVEEAWLRRVEWESGAEERFRPAIRPVSDS